MVLPLIENFISKIMPPKNTFKRPEGFNETEDKDKCISNKNQKLFAYLLIIIIIIIVLVMSFRNKSDITSTTSEGLFLKSQ